MKTVKVLNIHITELVWNMGLQTWSFPQIVFSDDVATKLKFFSHTKSWQAIQTHHFWSHYWVSFPISYSVKFYCIWHWLLYIPMAALKQWIKCTVLPCEFDISTPNDIIIEIFSMYKLYWILISMMMSLGVDILNSQDNTVYLIHCFKLYWE